ncbi:MAG TPA: sigma-70 family RNA polymerase sigma factor [Candidatus Angelobacter sp.]|nr:sigma-70 family RNA polymerase sigma factor [Candidatus Angelobacter sp.]
MISGSKPEETDLTTLTTLQALFQRSAGERYGLTVAQFEEILEQVAAKYLPAATPSQKLKLWQELRLEELALARACANGHDTAWQEFLTRYREKLYDVARGITREDSRARELADSLYADLYGTTERQGKRLSRLGSYMGRGSLEGWLRTVLAQEFVNGYRRQKRLVSLEEQAEDGVQFRAAENQPGGPADNRLEAATDEALAGLSAEDRMVMAAYYLDNRTLTEIGKVVGVHESTISRRLEKMLKNLRKQIMGGLQARGMSRGQAEEALETDVRYIMVDVKRKLQETPSQAFHGKGTD